MNGQTCDGWLIGKAVNFFTKPAGKDWPGDWYDRCTGTPACKVVSGCVHEHVIVWDACPDCARQIAAQIRDKKAARCCRCSSGAGAHVCPVLVEVRTPTAAFGRS